VASWETFWEDWTGTAQDYEEPDDPMPSPDVDVEKIEQRYEDKYNRERKKHRENKPKDNKGGKDGKDGKGGKHGARDELKWVLEGFGLRPAQFGDIIDKAIRNGWSPQQFEAAIYRSKPFRQTFPGIFRGDGSLRMSPYEYLQQADAYRELAQRYGLRGGLDDKRIGKLIEGNVSMTELNDRFSALYRMEEYKPYMQAFKEVLASNGITRKFNEEEMFRFVMGESPKEFYEIWEQASVGASATRAGLDLSAKEMKSIARMVPGVQDEAALYGNFQQLAQKVQTLLPLSRMAKFGITKKDLIELEFGGANQSAIATRVEELINVLTGEHDESRKAKNTGVLQSSQTRLHGVTS